MTARGFIMLQTVSERYQILEEIGRGGMAIVYKATDNLLDRPVALKVMREELVKDETLRERFLAEARAVASLSHSNIVAVYDVGVSEDRPYLVMEYLSGP